MTEEIVFAPITLTRDGRIKVVNSQEEYDDSLAVGWKVPTETPQRGRNSAGQQRGTTWGISQDRKKAIGNAQRENSLRFPDEFKTDGLKLECKVLKVGERQKKVLSEPSNPSAPENFFLVAQFEHNGKKFLTFANDTDEAGNTVNFTVAFDPNAAANAAWSFTR